MSDNDWWLDCCDMPMPLHADSCISRVTATTIDGVRVTAGLRVIDYNFDKGEVHSVDHVANDGTPWFRITLDNGGQSLMDGLRLWTKVQTADGWEFGDLRKQSIYDVRKIHGPVAADLVINGWTPEAAISHVEGACDRALCTGDHDE
jgi:hypothetical protein